MYSVTNRSTGLTKQFKTLQAAMNWKDRQDNNYGAVCTTYPKRVEVTNV